jgi:small subunit ribosomal protein S20
MANTASALKRVRQTATRTSRNRGSKSRLKTARKAALGAIASADAATAQASIRSAISLASRAAKSNVIHKNAVSRLQSRLAKAANVKAKAAK